MRCNTRRLRGTAPIAAQTVLIVCCTAWFSVIFLWSKSFISFRKTRSSGPGQSQRLCLDFFFLILSLKRIAPGPLLGVSNPKMPGPLGPDFY